MRHYTLIRKTNADKKEKKRVWHNLYSLNFKRGGCLRLYLITLHVAHELPNFECDARKIEFRRAQAGYNLAGLCERFMKINFIEQPTKKSIP